VQICAQARPAPATLEDAPGDEKRIRPKSHPGGAHNVAQIRSPGQYCGQKTEPTEILSGKPDQVSPGLATGDGFQSGVRNRPIPRHGTITGSDRLARACARLLGLADKDASPRVTPGGRRGNSRCPLRCPHPTSWAP
ncbi:hypothetical protein ACLKA7_007769, partial [Drosophila subpalustris]